MHVLILDKKIYVDTHKTKLADKLCAAKKKNPNIKIKWLFFSTMNFNNTFEGKREILKNYIEKLIMLDKI